MKTYGKKFRAASERREQGKSYEAKQAIDGFHLTAEERLKSSGTSAARAAGAATDPTLPGTRPRIGHLHPITQTIDELKDIMGRLGFSVADGPEIEDEWHNFEALNIPASHPGCHARAVAGPYRRTDLELHPLGRALPDQQVEVAPDVGGYGIVHPVPAHARGAAES